MEIKVENSKLLIGDREFNNYKIKEEIGGGANGIVYLVRNLTLQRDEALKVWIKRKRVDNRDKVEQGLYEAQKLARVNGNNAVQIYSAQEFNGFFVATMEYFKGQTLKEFIAGKNAKQICKILRYYLEAIEETSTIDTFHGDAHENNILIRESIIDYENVIELKLCDFGTSIFSGKDRSVERHWKIVRETILKCTNGMQLYNESLELLKDFEKSLLDVQRKMMDEISSGKVEFYDARIFTAPYKDYLEYLESVN
ncbi:protein kinase domain-containing protein [Clostridium beijerinckii]|uniref:protein kinase domain-containing protein n=1 Tax=Clostridium beijerinckii TaxID=1520 RepID=UPI000311CC4D|nr:protein kinase [Clostridium beijerinckii]